MVVQLALAVVAGLLSEGVPPAPVLVAISGVSALAAVAIALSLRVRSLAAVGLVRVPVRTVLSASDSAWSCGWSPAS